MSHNFKPGQRIVCIVSKFKDLDTQQITKIAPKNKEIVTFERNAIMFPNCIILKEYQRCQSSDNRLEAWSSDGFRSLQPFEESSSKEILEKFKITEEKAEILRKTEPKKELSCRQM